MAQTNRIPNGFLDLVGAETGGKNPPRYRDELVPGVDMSVLLSAQTLSARTDSLGGHTAPATLTIEVPDNEMWILMAASVSTTFTDTAWFEQWNLGVSRLPRSATAGFDPVLWSTRLLENTVVVGQAAIDSFTFPVPIPLLSGTQLNWILSKRDGGIARTSQMKLLYSLLTT